MKTCSLYGFISALGGAFLTLILFFMGLHSDPAKLGVSGWVGGLAGLGIAVACVALGTKARRAEVPETESFGYGRALGAGVLISLVASALSSAFVFLYWKFINPGIADIVVQSQVAKLEASGVSGDRLDKAEAMTRIMASPGPQAIVALIGGFVAGVLISLVVAAVLKRAEPQTPPTL
jgi:hypothetical protein